MSKKEFKNIPGVDKLLNDGRIKSMLKLYSRDFIVYCIRNELSSIRNGCTDGEQIPQIEEILENCIRRINNFINPTFKKVINATGIALHTNLGRAPLGNAVMEEIEPLVYGYSNLEFNLATGKRGKRTDHVIKLVKYITQAEDAVIVNNNAAAVSLSLRTFAENREVIVSRGELIEIGGSFRLPEIMNASGAITREVGTTNRTRISDYESAINEDTRIILKANRSNYSIEGFTEDTGIKELSELAKKKGLIFLYDIGSGLLKQFENLPYLKEPDVQSNMKLGVDLITFSCDKLLGGPQAGIIAGKKELISIIAKSPLMRTYRVDKFTIAALSSVLRCYLKESDLKNTLPAHKYLNRDITQLRSLAEDINTELSKWNIDCEIVKSNASCGGGTVPHLKLESYAVKIIPRGSNKDFAGECYLKLLSADIPVVGIVKEGNFYLDVFTVEYEDIQYIANTLRSAL